MQEDNLIEDLNTLLGENISITEDTRMTTEAFSEASNKVTLLDAEEESSKSEIREPSLILKEYTDLENSKNNLDEQLDTLKIKYPEVFSILEKIDKDRKDIEEKQNSLKDEMTESLNQADMKKVANSVFSVTYVAATERANFDKKAFEKKYPELCKQFITMSPVAAYTKWTKVK